MEGTQNGWPGIALAVACVLFVIAGYTMDRTGVPHGYVIALSAAFGLVVWSVSAFAGGTTRATRFLYANNTLSPGIASLALACVAVPPLLLLDGGRIIASSPGNYASLAAGSVSGIALSALLATRPFGGSGQSEICGYLRDRYGSNLPGGMLAPVLAIALWLMMVAAIGGMAPILKWYFATSETSVLIWFGLLTALAAILGGIVSASRLAAAAFVCLLIAVNLPLFFLALEAGGIPAGHLTAGSLALSPMWDLEDQLRSLRFPALSDILTGPAPMDGWRPDAVMAAAALMAAALAAFPSFLQLQASGKSTAQAGRAAGNAVLFAGFLLLSVFAFMAFAAHGFYQTMLGLPAGEARISAPVLHSWGEREQELVTLCGKLLRSAQELESACGDGTRHIISTSDLVIDGHLFSLAATEFNGMSVSLTAFLVVSASLAVSALCAMLALAAANTLTGAYYAPLQKATGSRRVFWSRLGIALFVLIGSLAAGWHDINALALFMGGASLIAATVLPALIAAVHLPQIEKAGVSTAIGTGLAITLVMMVLTSVGVDLVPDTDDEVRLGFFGLTSPLPASLSGLFGLLGAALVLVAAWISAALEGMPRRKSARDSAKA